MQLLLNFKSDSKMTIDERSIRIMQGFIYHKLSEIGAGYIHEDFFSYGTKVFRHFCFSDMIDSTHESEDIFETAYSFYFSTSLSFIIPEFCEYLYSKGVFYGRNKLECTEIKVLDTAVDDDLISVKTMSPVVCDKTIHLENGKKKRLYFSPLDDDFLPIIKKNLIDKYNSINSEKIEDAELEIRNIKHCKKSSKKYFKPTKNSHVEIIIKGYDFEGELKGDRRLLKTALLSGLGAKNAQGFGFIKKS